MNHGSKISTVLAVAAVLTFSAPCHAVNVIWADWESSTSTTVEGMLATSTPIAIEFSSPAGFAFVQTGSGTNYWTEPNPTARPYTGGVVENAPPAAELIALSGGGQKTITFGEPISGLYLAIISWNGNTAQFDQPFTVISQGQGYWGNGTIALGDDNTFVGTGEPHGILYFPGTFSSLTFTDATENWHGLTVGVASLASDVIPEPASAAALALLLTSSAALHRRRQVRATTR